MMAQMQSQGLKCFVAANDGGEWRRYPSNFVIISTCVSASTLLVFRALCSKNISNLRGLSALAVKKIHRCRSRHSAP